MRNACLITIDDGDKSFYNVIYPILKKYNVPAVLFVSPEAIINNNNFWFQEAKRLHLNNEQLKKLKIDEIWENIKDNKLYSIEVLPPQNINIEQLFKIDKYGLVELGGHTMTHPILANESDDKSNYEIVNSLKELEKILGHSVKCFAYPNGRPSIDFGPREINILMQTNCKIAFSTEPRNISKNDNIYSVPRFGLTYGTILFVRLKLFMGKYWRLLKINK